jgi:hypothetical protein
MRTLYDKNNIYMHKRFLSNYALDLKEANNNQVFGELLAHLDSSQDTCDLCVKEISRRLRNSGFLESEYSPEEEKNLDVDRRNPSANYFKLGAVLKTRDGNRIGNGYVDEIYDDETAMVVTESGSKILFHLKDFVELFYPPETFVNINQARKSIHISKYA